MDWTFIYMMFVLKIPIALLLGIVWWAIRSEPQQADVPAEGGGGGTKVRPHHPRHPRRPLPRNPRRGPHHGGPAPAPPPRTRTVLARARRVDHA